MFYCGYWVSIGCVFGMVLLSVLWGVLGEYWICVFGQIPLSVLWRVLCEYWMCIWSGLVECFIAGIG